MTTLAWWTGATIISILAGLIAACVIHLDRSRLRRSERSLVDRIDALLPQTQCGQCGHPGCRPYAEAIAGGAAFNRCPPGREPTVIALAELLHEPIVPLDIDGDLKPKAVAFIREAECIGCTKCIQACPVDAIVGAAKLMHTVIGDECTGCDLCLEPCPVDCIEMRPLPASLHAISPPQAAHYKQRFEAHNLRLQREHQERELLRQQRKAATRAAAQTAPTMTATIAAATPATSKQDQIQAAIARAKAKRAAAGNGGPQQ